MPRSRHLATVIFDPAPDAQSVFVAKGGIFFANDTQSLTQQTSVIRGLLSCPLLEK